MTITVASIISTLAVAVAAVVVVLAIIAVIIMVLRSNGGRQAAGGIGYDARQRGMGPGQNDYDPSASPWAHQANRAASSGMGHDPAGNYGAPARTSGANWSMQPSEQPPAGAWGTPSGANYGQGPAAPAPANGGWNDAGRGWNGGTGAPAMGGAPLGQSQQPWDAQGAQAGARPWDAQAAPAWAGQQPSNGAWGQADPSMMSAAPWNGAPSAVEQPAAPNSWGMPPASAAPSQNAWGIPSGGAAPSQNAWGVPSMASAAPAADAWGAPAAPTSPAWGNPAPGGAPAAWGTAAPAGAGYDAPPSAGHYGNEVDPRQRPTGGPGVGGGAVVVRAGKEPGRVYEIRGDRLTIGRSRDSDIFLEDLAVSRLHAIIYRDHNGQYLVRDEGSANGTTVNGQRISEYALEENDEIGLGQTVLAFVRR